MAPPRKSTKRPATAKPGSFGGRAVQKNNPNAIKGVTTGPFVDVDEDDHFCTSSLGSPGLANSIGSSFMDTSDLANTKKVRERSATATSGNATLSEESTPPPALKGKNHSKNKKKQLMRKGKVKKAKSSTKRDTGNTNSKRSGSKADVDETELYRCICGLSAVADEGVLSICCDGCNKWQHQQCMGLNREECEGRDEYFYEQCCPEEHHDICQALERGDENPKKRKEDVATLMKLAEDLNWFRASWDGMPFTMTQYDGRNKDFGDGIKKSKGKAKVGGKPKTQIPSTGAKPVEPVARGTSVQRSRKRISYADTAIEEDEAELEPDSLLDAKPKSSGKTKAGPSPSTTLPKEPDAFALGIKRGLQALFDTAEPKVLNVWVFDLATPRPHPAGLEERIRIAFRWTASRLWSGPTGDRDAAVALDLFGEVLGYAPKGHHELAEDEDAWYAWATRNFPVRFPSQAGEVLPGVTIR